MKMNFHHYIVAMVAACPFMLSASATGLTTHHVGSDNTLVSIAPECAAAHKYLLLPVEESVDDARVNVLLDGKPETTFYVRLARNKIDYYVPFDLSRYPGKNIVLDVTTAQSRSTVREAAQDVCWRTLELSDTFSTVNREKYRPAYHHTPLYGWMNDPNGMFYKDGKWHLYYQYNPYGSKWQNMSWGHSVSTDLVNWEHLPVALEPDGLGTIFSGSCVVDTAATAGQGKDAVIALYTSAGRNQMQSMASSTDGGTSFVPFPANPVLTLETEARDPNMFWNPEIGKWNMVLAHPLEKEILIFSSPDLKEWTLESAFGKGLGNQQGVWECPDLIKLTIPGTDKSKWVMICNINPGNPMGGSGIQYFVGDFDGVTFTPDTDAEGCVPTKWLDGGKDNYALVTWSGAPDGRCVSIGWMSNWQYAAEVPTTQFRSANTLPRELSLFAADDNQFYVASLPSPEVDALRGHKTSSLKAKALSTKALNVTLPEGNDGVCEILADVDALKSAGTVFTLSNHIGEKVVITVDVANHTISFDRSHSGVTDFSHDFPAVITSPIHFSDRAFTLRIFVDRSSIEVFDGQGRYVVTNLVFPTSPYTSLGISALDGKAKLNSLDIYSLKALY